MRPLPADTSPSPRSRSLPLRRKLGYAAGGLVDGTALHPLNIFLLFYVTSVVGLPGALAGAAIAAGLIFDAVSDPLVGSMSDRWRSRLGRRLPFMLAALPFVAISLTLIFWLPTDLGTLALFFWFLTLSICLRVSVALFLLPHQALGAELSNDYVERSQIMALRWSFFMAGGIAGVALGFGLFFTGPEGLSQHGQYLPFALTLSVIVLVGGLVAAHAAYRTRDLQHPVADGPVLGVISDLSEVRRSRSFLTLFAGATLFFIGFGINSVLGLHVNTFFWNLPTGGVQAVTISLFVGLFFGAPLAGPCLRLAEKRNVICGAIIVLLALQASPILLRLAGLLPLEGTQLGIALSIVSLTIGMMMGIAGIGILSALADAADEHELIFGTRREGLYYAGFAFANKGASGFGTLIAGLVLQLVDFPVASGASGAELAASVTDEMARIMALAYGPGAALVSVAAVAVNGFYSIDRARHGAIVAELASRRRVATGTVEAAAHGNTTPTRRSGASLSSG